MSWILVILGALLGSIVGLVLFVIVLWLGFKFWLRRKFAGFVDQLDGIEQMLDVVPPFRLRLLPGPTPQFEEEQARRLYAGLIDRGFVETGTYHTEGSPAFSFSVRGLVHDQLGIYGGLFHHSQIGYWIDLVTPYPDGTVVTYSTNQDPGVGHPEWSHTTNLPDTEATALLDAMLTGRSRSAPPADPAKFVEVLTDSYNQGMDWRIAQGGFNDEQIQMQLSKGGLTDPTLTASTTLAIKEQWRTRINEFYDEQLRQRFLNATKLEPAKWEQIREQVVFVHDRLTSADLVARCTDFLNQAGDDDVEEGGLFEELEKVSEQGTARAVVGRIAELMAKRFNVSKLGTIKQPIEADVYRFAPKTLVPSTPAIGHSA